MKIEVADNHVMHLLVMDRELARRAPQVAPLGRDLRMLAGELHGLLIDLDVTAAMRRPRRWAESKLIEIAAVALLAAAAVARKRP